MRQSSSINAPHVNTIVFEAGVDDPRIIAGTVDPSAGAGVEALEGSISLRHVDTAGEAWLKTGAADTAWTQLVAGAASVPDPFTPTDGTWNLTGNQDISGTLDVGGTSTLAGLAISNDGTITTLLGAVGDYVRIGDAAGTDHGLNSEDDLMVSGDFEVDGAASFDGIATFYTGMICNTDVSFSFGGGSSTLAVRSGQTPDALVLSLPITSRALIVCEHGDHGFDFAFAQLPDPAIVLTSANQTTDERGWLTHDQTDFVIDAGKGNVRLGRHLARTTTANITASATQTQGQGALTSDYNEIVTIGTDLDVVTLPAAVEGMRITVVNNCQNVLQIFPASGDDAGAGVDLSVTLESSQTTVFVARDATTWLTESSTQITHAEFTQSQNGTAFTMSVAGQPHCYHSATLNTSDTVGWVFDAGGAGTVPAIASIADGGSGEIDVTTSGAHGLAVGDIVSVTNTGDANYDKVHVVTSIGSTTIFGVVATYTATGTGSVNQAATLTAGVERDGEYMCAWSASATNATNNETFDFVMYVNAVAQLKTEARRKFGTSTDYGVLSNMALLTIAAGDVVSWTVQNNDSAGNLTVRNINLVLTKL